MLLEINVVDLPILLEQIDDTTYSGIVMIHHSCYLVDRVFVNLMKIYNIDPSLMRHEPRFEGFFVYSFVVICGFFGDLLGLVFERILGAAVL